MTLRVCLGSHVAEMEHDFRRGGVTKASRCFGTSVIYHIEQLHPSMNQNGIHITYTIRRIYCSKAIVVSRSSHIHRSFLRPSERYRHRQHGFFAHARAQPQKLGRSHSFEKGSTIAKTKGKKGMRSLPSSQSPMRHQRPRLAVHSLPRGLFGMHDCGQKTRGQSQESWHEVSDTRHVRERVY